MREESIMDQIIRRSLFYVVVCLMTFYFLSFFLMALGPTILGHNLYNYSLRHLPAFPVGISILGEPVLATIWGILIFGEQPLSSTLLGGLVIIMAIVLVMTQMKSESEVVAP